MTTVAKKPGVKKPKVIIECSETARGYIDKNIPETGRDLQTLDKRFVGLDFDLYVSTFYTAKYNSCKTEGKEFALTLAQVRAFLSTKKCQMMGIELTHMKAGANFTRPTDLSFDRIDNTKGYTKDNVMIICYAANQAKSAFEGWFAKGCGNAAIHTMSAALKKKGL